MKPLCRRITAALLAVLTAAGLCVGVLSADRRIVRVGFFPFAGYHVVDGEGNRSGYGYDYLQKLLDYADWSYEYVGYETDKSWSDMLRMLKNGEIDLLTSASKTPEREAEFAYSSEPIGTSATILTVKAGNTRYSSDDTLSWNGMRVGMLLGSSRNGNFDAYAKRLRVIYAPMYYKSTEELTEALQNGEIDAIVTSNLRQLQGEWLLAQFDQQPFYAIVRKEDTTLLAELDYAIEQLHTTHPDFEDSLFRRYYSPQSGDQIAYTAEERAFIRSCQENGTVFEAILNPDRRPYSYLEDGEMKGILADVCREIFNRTGLTIHFRTAADRVEYQTMRREGAAAICCDCSTSFSAAENAGYVLTSPYFDSSIARVTRRDFTGSVKTAGMLRSGLVAEAMENSLDSRTKIIWFDSIQASVNAVRQKKIDAAYLFVLSGQNAFYTDVTNQLACVSLPQQTVQFAIGVRTEEDYLLSSVLDKALSSLSKEDMTDLSAPYLQNQLKDQTLVGIFYSQPLFAVSCLAGLFLLIFLIAFSVILRRRQLEQEQANLDLQRAVEEADRANRAKSDFISRISHDIRTPMNAIHSMTQFAMQDRNEPEKLMDDLNKIRSSNVYLLSLVNDVLDISKIDSNAVELHPEVYRYSDYTANIRNIFEPLCQEKNLKFTIEGRSCNRPVIADRTRLDQITLNLVSNAVKYTPPGGEIALLVTGRDMGSEIAVTIEVRDTGIGMSEEFQAHMFEPFTQDLENEARRRLERGSGLGLSIVRRLTQLMGGEISVHSELGRGTSVLLQFTFPGAPVDTAAPYEPDGANQTIQPLTGTVLLAEDNAINMQIACRLLESFGLTVVCCEDGQAALECFARSRVGEFAAVLMDIQMPRMDGYKAAAAIRALGRGDARTVPILAMTADVFAESARRSEEAGMNGRIAKPIDVKELYRELRRWIAG